MEPAEGNRTAPILNGTHFTPLLETAFNQGVSNFANNTVHMLSDGTRKYVSSIKYYFAVDQNYVMQKLSLLLFPFQSRDWLLRYSNQGPIPPRADTNAPDYYIPLMSAITYILLVGVVLGLQNRFTPEQLGIHASSIIVWSIIENCLLGFIFYILNMQSNLRALDLIAYCGYKYVGIIAVLIFYISTRSLLISRCALLYFSFSIAYFLIKCLRLQILPDVNGTQSYDKRRIYLLLIIVILQPVFIWYFTWHLLV